MPAAGRRDRRVLIEVPTEVGGPLGPEQTWAEFATVWGGKRDIRGQERVRAQGELATETAVWTLPYVPGLTAAMRMTADGKIYDIEGVAEIGRRAGWEITATAKVL